MEVNITDSAINRIKELIEGKDSKNIGLRVSVDGGGCSGFMYNYELIDSVKEDDFIIENNGVKVAIDPISQSFLEGCTVEFIRELGSSYFQIKNPKAVAKCGCGSSFAL